MMALLVLGLAILPIIGAVKGQAYRGAYLATSMAFGAVGGLAFFMALAPAPTALDHPDEATRVGAEFIEAWAIPVAMSCWVIAFGCLIATAAYRRPAARPDTRPPSWFDPDHPRHRQEGDDVRRSP